MSMEFCETCGSMLEPKRVDGKVVMSCPKCGEVGELSKEKQTLTDKVQHSTEESMVVIEDPDSFSTMPIKKMPCPKCKKNTDTQYWAVQTRSGDEAPTRFYRCTKCKHTWREYD